MSCGWQPFMLGPSCEGDPACTGCGDEYEDEDGELED